MPPKKTEVQRRLGRGLAALLGTDTAIGDGLPRFGDQTAPVEFLRPNSRNPREIFLERELDELAASIKERGILQPIIVRKIENIDGYEIIAGERRWRAAQQAGLHKVPIVAISVGDKDALEISIIENVQRTDLNPLEEAKAYSLLAAEYGYNQSDIGRVVGKSRSHVANTLRLLALPQHTRDLVSKGTLSAGHARAILPLSDADTVADQIVKEGLSVRDVENISRNKKPGKVLDSERKSPNLSDLEHRISVKLGASCTLVEGAKGFQIKLSATTFEEMTAICTKLLE